MDAHHGRMIQPSGVNARLVRYADDFVILARYQGDKLNDWTTSKIETWMGLEINYFVRNRLVVHLRRRSQRPFRVPEGETFYNHLKKLGLVYL